MQARGYCTGANGQQRISQAACTGAGGTWNPVAAFNIPAPQCVAAPVTRDNHLGNDATGNEVFANLTVPSPGITANSAAQACTVRMRYNITTADTRACSIAGLATRAQCEAQNGVWSSFYVDASMNNDVSDTNPQPGQMLAGNPTTNMGGALAGGGGTNSILELAVNTNQYGRTFQDRSHVFSIEPRPAAVPQNVNIYNLNVKGKRGNIVQTYPATEYDFHPVDLVVGSQDLVHIQWTGNDNTNNNGNNNGEGTNNEDRHNIVQLDNTGLDVPAPGSQATMFDVAWEWNPEPTGGTFGGARAQTALVKQAALAKQQGCAANPNNDQQRTNCEKLNNAAATVNLGLLRFKPGNYNYMSSRNNNFSNRAQKAKLTTLTEASALPEAPTNVRAWPIDSINNDENQASMMVSWAPPGETVPYIGTDGRNYTGYSQAAQVPIAYTVQYSCDGGETWTPTNCANTERQCQIDMLPAGQPCAFRVRSGAPGGWSAPSETAVALTRHTAATLADYEARMAAASGGGISGGTIALIIIVILVIACAVGGALWCFCMGGADKFKGKPPPPPPAKFDQPIPPPPTQPQYGGY